MEKLYRKLAPKALVPYSFFILVNNPKHPLFARNYFKSKMF